jgi:hypothetical protein
MASSTVLALLAARRVADYAMGLGADIPTDETRPVYDHMGALVADCVLQAGLNYKTVVLPRITAILTDHPGRDRVATLLPLVKAEGTGAFLNWTHFEKIDRFDALVGFLEGQAVDDVSDLRKAMETAEFAPALRAVRGVGPKTVDYMGGLAGLDTVAVDRHIRTFAKRAGVEDDGYEHLRKAFCAAADLLGVPRRQFDGWVWRFESEAAAKPKRPKTDPTKAAAD